MKGWNYKIDQSWNVMSYQWIHDIIDTQFISEKNTLSRNILFNESSPYEGLMREIFIPNCFDIETKLICEAINPEIAKSVYLKSTHLNLDETMIGFEGKGKKTHDAGRLGDQTINSVTIFMIHYSFDGPIWKTYLSIYLWIFMNISHPPTPKKKSNMFELHPQ